MTQHQIKSATMNFFRTLLVCSLGTLGFQSFGQITEKNYKIYSTKSNKEVTLSDIIEDMKNNDVLFFGEEHNDSVTHYLEVKILEMLSKKFSNNIALSMEMFDRDVQPVMNEYLLGFLEEKDFTKGARVWSNYRDYKPMVEFAKNNKLDVICANAPTRYANLAGRKGQKALMELSDKAKSYFAPLPYDTASGKLYEKLMMTISSHRGPSNKDTTHRTTSKDTVAKKVSSIPSLGNFNIGMSHSLWNATMAYSISKSLEKNKGKKVLQVNGRFHSDEGLGIVTQLKKYSPQAKALIISSFSDDSFPKIDWNEVKNLGDYVIATDKNVPKTFKE